MKTSKSIYNAINKLTREIADSIYTITTFERDFNVQFLKPTFSGTNLKNKLIELEDKFNNANTPFLGEDEFYESPVSVAILMDIIYYLIQVSYLLQNITKEINVANGINSSHPTKKYRNTQPVLSQKQIDSINSKIALANEITEDLNSYSLENNILDALVFHIDENYYEKEPDITLWIDEKCRIPLLRLGQEDTLRKLKRIYKKRQHLNYINQENIGIICGQEEILKRLRRFIFLVGYTIMRLDDTPQKKSYQRDFNRILNSDYTVDEYPIMITELKRLFLDIPEEKKMKEHPTPQTISYFKKMHMKSGK